MTEYLSCIQVRSPLWLILMTQNCFREKSLCHFACKCHHFAVFQSRFGKNFYQNQLMSWLCCFWAVTSTKNFKSFNLMIQKSTIGRFSKYSKINVSIFWIFWNFFQNFWNFFEYIRKIENHESVLYDEFGVDCDLIDKLFYFFNRQSLLLAGKQDIKLYSILAGIILFAPDRGLSKLSYRKSKIGTDSGQTYHWGPQFGGQIV